MITTNNVSDFNTQFSGVRAEDVEKAVMDVNEVRKAACAFIDENTIMVGHGYVTTRLS